MKRVLNTFRVTVAIWYSTNNGHYRLTAHFKRILKRYTWLQQAWATECNVTTADYCDKNQSD